MTKIYHAYYESPIGLMELTGSESAITSLNFVEQPTGEATNQAYLKAALSQLDEYFQGQRQSFELELSPGGTDFQKQVWRQLLTVPYGQTVSYQDIANSINNPKAIRAVGAANGQNPISIIVPCHRIIGSNGKLTGYGGGLWRKEWLLKHEGGLLF